jgi:RimJ/RimL family protein N-acetyltransferase
MSNPVVKLQLRLDSFDERPFLPQLEKCLKTGISLTTLRLQGDTPENRKKLYELNKTCSQDILGRGPFYTWEEYLSQRIENTRYTPSGVIIALAGDEWIGMSVLSDWLDKGFVFYEMTGVLRQHRRRGIAMAMKIESVRFAKSLGAKRILTFHAAANLAPIALNRSLGFVPAEWENLSDA